jgi:hypothetical protein
LDGKHFTETFFLAGEMEAMDRVVLIWLISRVEPPSYD